MSLATGSYPRLQSALAILLAAVLFVALVLIAQTTLRGARLDLTEDDLYTVSPQTREILAGLERPIELTFYFSYEAAEDVPFVRQYAQRVRELLEEYVAYADGMIRLEVVDPRPLTPARDRAVEYGLEAVPASSGNDVRIFMGLVATNRVEGLEVIEFFEPERERFLEYDITRLIWSLQKPDKPVVGVMSRLPITQTYDIGTGQPREPWAIVDRLGEIAEVRRVETPTDRIDPEIDVLVVAHPYGHDDATLYALDQWLVHHGGRAVVMLDPAALIAGERDGADGPRVSRSQVGPLLDAWGVDVTLEQTLADPRNGMIVELGETAGRTVHPGLIGIMAEGIDRQDVITAELERLLVGASGIIRAREGGMAVRPLLWSSESAGLLPAERYAGLEDPRELARGFRPDGERHVLAARLEGPLRSAWPDGPPEGALAPTAGHRAGSAGDAHMVLVADVDLMSDRLWVRERQGAGGSRVREAWSDNGDFVVNAVDNLLGGDALIGIRGEGTSARPFTRVQALEREAAARYRETEQRLRRALEETEQRLRALRSGEGGDEDGEVILSEAQREALERFRDERVRLRKELRRVQQQLDAEIAALGDRLKLLNILAMPLLVAFTGLLVALLRRRGRRRRARR